MKIIRFIRGRCAGVAIATAAQRRLSRQFSETADEITRAQWNDSLQNPAEFYERCFHYFHTRLPEELRAHRTYFETGGRGFGEKTFHVMWFLLFREFSPESFLEIGVYRGQTLSPWRFARGSFQNKLPRPGRLAVFFRRRQCFKIPAEH